MMCVCVCLRGLCAIFTVLGGYNMSFYLYLRVHDDVCVCLCFRGLCAIFTVLGGYICTCLYMLCVCLCLRGLCSIFTICQVIVSSTLEP